MPQDEKTNWYADEDTISAIQSMNEDEMRSLLLHLTTERTWIAILRYLQLRFQIVQQALRTLDADKAPTDISRTQGYLNGLTDIPDAVASLVDESKAIAEEHEESK